MTSTLTMTNVERKRILLPVGMGIGGAFFLTFIYFSIISLAEDFQHALTLFGEERNIVLPLIFGFGVQVALYTVLKKQLFIPIANTGASGALTGAGGTTSSVAMIACCAHHAVDVLPILGLTAAATFLAEYQTLFMWIGLGTTLAGIAAMLFILFRERKKVLHSNPELTAENTAGYNTTPLFIMLGIFVFLYAGTAVSFEIFSPKDQPIVQTAAQNSDQPEAQTDQEYPIVITAVPDNETAGNITGWLDTPKLTDNQGAVTVNVTPLNLNNPNDNLSFGIALDTHSVDLSMDLATLATLITDTGLNLTGQLWDAPRGGHHVSGVLSFAISPTDLDVLSNATQLTLTIVNLDAPERIFTWEKQP